MAHSASLRRLDRRLSRRVQRLQLRALDYVVAVPALLFGEYGVPLLLIGLWWAFGGRFALFVAFASLALLACTTYLKLRFARRRPVPLAPRALPLRRLAGSAAFPSGDAAQAALFAVLLIAALSGPQRWWLVLAPPLCMFGRVYFGAHWISDTVGGVAIGAAFAGLAVAVAALLDLGGIGTLGAP